MNETLGNVSRLILGSGRLTDASDLDQLALARKARDMGLWVHTSQEYGKGAVFRTLRTAFGRQSSHHPPYIAKVDGRSPDSLRSTIHQTLRKLNLERLAIAQVCGGPTIEPQSPIVDVMHRLKREGKVGAYLLEIYHSKSDSAANVVRHGLCDGVIFYWNVVNREVSNGLFDLLQHKRTPIVSLRALGGGPWSLEGPPEPNRARALLDELRSASDCPDALAFRLRFALSLPGAVGTVAATRSMEHLERLIETVQRYKPLQAQIADSIHQAHRQWFERAGMA